MVTDLGFPQTRNAVQGSVAVVMALGVANRVLYKMVLNPLSDYVFFLAQFQTFSYVGVYFAVLAYKRYWCATTATGCAQARGLHTLP